MKMVAVISFQVIIIRFCLCQKNSGLKTAAIQKPEKATCTMADSPF